MAPLTSRVRTCLSCLAVLASILPSTLVAQMATDRGSLRIKNWAAPAFWHPSHVLPNDATPHAAGNTTEALAFIAMTPCRVVDTRASQGFSGPFGAPALVGGSSRTFPVQSSTTCSIPTTAQAYSLNITVVPPAPLGFHNRVPNRPAPSARRNCEFPRRIYSR